MTKLRIMRLPYMQDFYNSLNSVYSKVIFHFPPNHLPWVTYNGIHGESADTLRHAVGSIDWKEDEYLAIIVHRSALGFHMNILPKTAADIEY